jgi:hypothetical protein
MEEQPFVYKAFLSPQLHSTYDETEDVSKQNIEVQALYGARGRSYCAKIENSFSLHIQSHLIDAANVSDGLVRDCIAGAATTALSRCTSMLI